MNSVGIVYIILVTLSFTMVLETAVDLIEVYLFPLKEGKVSNNQPPFALQKASRNMLISHVGEKRKKY